MWILWNRDLDHVEDQWDCDKESSDGIPVLSSDRENDKRTGNNHKDSSSEHDVIINGNRESLAICR